MRLTSVISSLSIAITLCTSALSAEGNTDLIPMFRLKGATEDPARCGAVGFLGEAGEWCYRASGTYGLYLTPWHRTKVTVEGLRQNLDYDFKGTRRHPNKWVKQLAVGAEYQYLISDCQLQSLDLRAAYSTTTSIRRVAGSTGGYASVGATITPWYGALVAIAADYDYVTFDRKHEHRKAAKGIGGSFRIAQDFNHYLGLIAEVDIRRSYTFYEVLFNWSDCLCGWEVEYGLYGNHTAGRFGLSSVTAIGFQFTVYGESGSCCEVDPTYWVATPAVYMPIVMSTRD